MVNQQSEQKQNGAGNRIRPLPAWLVNKIAAGEVIERPASCVKELIENAIDAGAGEINIAVSQGGKKLIRVSDNGSGIFPEDLAMLFQSHSTSKITREDDLYNIHTFGFRGEALASMAAIAKIRLLSKTATQPEAYEISVSHGKISAPRPAAGTNGTAIEITDLFYQTPARKKFLKSDGVELSHISETVSRFAIAYPEISFTLITLPDKPGGDEAATASAPAGKKTLLSLQAVKEEFTGAVLKRLAFFYGSETAAELISASDKTGPIELQVLFSGPAQTRSNSKAQFFFLNRRFIRDRVISRAVYQAYHNLIPRGRYPFVALFIRMPPDAFDVNVHPTKTEVRFRESWKLHDQVISLIRNELARRTEARINAPESDSTRTPEPRAGTELGTPIPETQKAMQALVDFFALKSDPGRDSIYHNRPQPGGNAGWESPPEAARTQPQPQPQPQTRTQTRPANTPAGRNFQIFNSYIISETEDGIIIIDQHALHERILYERLSRQAAASEIYRQKFLIPVLVEIPGPKAMLMPEIISCLKKTGIEAEAFGKRTISVQSAPPLLNKINFTGFILEFIESYNEDAPGPGRPEPIDRLIKIMACKAAVKAGDPLAPEEINSLLNEAGAMDLITCPHGRPAAHKITRSELERFFRR